MCGIAGFTTREGKGFAAATIQSMMEVIHHRGPDSQGFHLADAGEAIVALGFVRLAIIDVAAGDQPFHSSDGALTLIFNGEIYNYVEIRAELEALGRRFRTHSDTEVLLTAYEQWGPDCLNRFRGMFALAIWDKVKRELFLARDPFGKKPLMLMEADGGIVFGSEFAALAAHPAFTGEIDDQAVAEYLVYKYVPGPGTLVAGVRELPPGHFGVWRDGRLEMRRYYSIPVHERDPGKQLPLNDATIADFRKELSEAIRLRMRSDVQLGAFLSGGIDSSAIVALMAEQSAQPVKTFSIGFHEEEFSELWASRLVAEKYRTDHHELKISPEDFLDRIEDVTWLRGAPLSEMADVPLYYLSKLASEHVKVVLSGEGSDELLAGYPKHWGDLYAARYQAAVPRPFDGLFLSFPGKMLPYGQRRLAIMLRAAQERNFLSRQAAWFGLMTREDAAALCPDLYARTQPFAWEGDPGPGAGALHRALAFDKDVWLPGTLLERGDRMTMAASIEGRMPFMDVKLAEFVSTLSDEAFLDGRTGKHILRRAMAGVLPEPILTRPKSGFRVPIHEWLRGRLRDFTRDMLLSPGAQFARYARRDRLEAILDDHDRQRRNREKEIWSILTLEIFLRQLRAAARVPQQSARSA